MGFKFTKYSQNIVTTLNVSSQNSGFDHGLIQVFFIKSSSVHAVELTETQLQTNFEPRKILAFYVLSGSAQIGF